MSSKTIMVDGVPVEVTDVSAAVIQRALAAKDAEIKRLADELEEEEAEKKKLEEEDKKSKDSIAAKDAEITTLKTQLSDATNPQKIEQAAKDRAAVVDKARVMIGDVLVVDGKSVSEIRRQVVDAKLKDAAKGWTDAQVETSFATLTADMQTADPLATALSHSLPTGDSRDKAYNGYVNYLGDAWKPKAST